MRLVKQGCVGLLAGAIVTVGCQSQKPVVRPQILNSRAPAGAPQSPPLNTTRTTPIDVPMAPVNPRVPGGVLVTPDAGAPLQQYVPPAPPAGVIQGGPPPAAIQGGPPAGAIQQVPPPNGAQLGNPQPTNSPRRELQNDAEDWGRSISTNPQNSTSRDRRQAPL